jgi:hypothetical protein
MITNLTIGRYGRLGNQIFQYAAAFSLAKRLNTELWIPSETETCNTNGRYNPTIGKLDVYNNDVFKLFDLKYGQKKPTFQIRSKIKSYYKEKNVVQYYPEFWGLQDGTCLHGYFQAKEYVDAYKEDLISEFSLNNEYFDYGSEYIQKLKKDFNKIVSVHIRRGDLTTDNHAFNANLSIDKYYKLILDQNTTSNDVVLIFSDDIDWCKTQFTDTNQIFIDNRTSRLPHLKDFSLMSMCDINIIGVSTFSWWSAWLNPLKLDKRIFMPNKWWGWSLQHNSEDVYRYDHWVRYENE